MLRYAFLGVFGVMAYVMAEGAEDWSEAFLLSVLPLSAGIASFWLVSD